MKLTERRTRMSLNVVTLDDYADFVTKLASPHSTADFNAKLATGGLGVAGEVGEVSRIVVSVLQEEEGWGPVVLKQLIDELGDVMWYTAFLANNVLDGSLEELKLRGCSLPRSTDPTDNMVDGIALLSSKAGKVADVAKKVLFHGMSYDDTVRRKLYFATADVYAATEHFAKCVCCCDVYELIRVNVEKLRERYASLKFTTEEFMAKETGK